MGQFSSSRRTAAITHTPFLLSPRRRRPDASTSGPVVLLLSEYTRPVVLLLSSDSGAATTRRSQHEEATQRSHHHASTTTQLPPRRRHETTRGGATHNHEQEQRRFDSDEQQPIQEHVVRTRYGCVSLAVYGEQDKPTLITYPDLALNFSILNCWHLQQPLPSSPFPVVQAALCWVKFNTNLKQQVGLPPKSICSFEGNQRKFVAMASTIPVQQVNNGPLQVTGDSFIREHLRKLSPYQPILPFEVLSARLGRKPEDIVKLDANENPYGPPPEVMEALGSIKFPYVYPDPESRRLRAALAQDSGLEAEYILAGCGADELIDLIMRCVLDPGDKIVDCPPTFTMYEFDAAVNGALVIKVSRKPDFSLNVEQISEVVKQEKPKCIFLTSPNNPDGSIIDDDVLLKILDLPILVILDEAYIEFSSVESRMSWVKKHENLIVLRTFSKRAGLAGLRVGYGAFPLSIIEYLWRAKQPYNVSVAAEISACAALQNPTYLENVKNALLKERGRLYDLLKEVPFLRPFPSHSNFILCEVTSGKDAKKLKEDLAQMGVMIRHYDKKDLKGYVRVTVGKPEQTDALMKCLKKLL